jgi:hypothetical protein
MQELMAQWLCWPILAILEVLGSIPIENTFIIWYLLEQVEFLMDSLWIPYGIYQECVSLDYFSRSQHSW